MKPKKHPKSMTKEQAFDRIAELYAAWSVDSNGTSDQAKLFEFGETAIRDVITTIAAGGGHPEPPPYPRIRP